MHARSRIRIYMHMCIYRYIYVHIHAHPDGGLQAFEAGHLFQMRVYRIFERHALGLYSAGELASITDLFLSCFSEKPHAKRIQMMAEVGLRLATQKLKCSSCSEVSCNHVEGNKA